MTFTDASVDDLVTCPKKITEAPARDFKTENRHRRKDMRLASLDGSRTYVVFIRQSLEFIEDFSIGLVYLHPDAKRITLVRYNGQHDQSNDPLDSAKLHFQYHIHRATADNLNDGRYEKPPAAETGPYASFDEATLAFLDEINLDSGDRSTHFPDLNQRDLFPPPEARDGR